LLKSISSSFCQIGITDLVNRYGKRDRYPNISYRTSRNNSFRCVFFFSLQIYKVHSDTVTNFWFPWMYWIWSDFTKEENLWSFRISLFFPRKLTSFQETEPFRRPLPRNSHIFTLLWYVKRVYNSKHICRVCRRNFGTQIF
jgi:hypothetical protein